MRERVLVPEVVAHAVQRALETFSEGMRRASTETLRPMAKERELELRRAFTSLRTAGGRSPCLSWATGG